MELGGALKHILESLLIKAATKYSGKWLLAKNKLAKWKNRARYLACNNSGVHKAYNFR